MNFTFPNGCFLPFQNFTQNRRNHFRYKWHPKMLALNGNELYTIQFFAYLFIPSLCHSICQVPSKKGPKIFRLPTESRLSSKIGSVKVASHQLVQDSFLISVLFIGSPIKFIWRNQTVLGLHHEVRSQTFRNNCKISRSQPQSSTLIVI